MKSAFLIVGLLAGAITATTALTVQCSGPYPLGLKAPTDRTTAAAPTGSSVSAQLASGPYAP